MRDRRHGFTMVFHEALDVLAQQLEGQRLFTARGVYLGLCEVCSREHRLRQDDDTFRMSKAKVAALIGVSKRTLDEYLPVLSALGLVRYEERVSETGANAPGEWSLLSPGNGAGAAPRDAGDGASAAPPTRARGGEGKKEEERDNPPTPHASSAERRVFDTWVASRGERNGPVPILTKDRLRKIRARLADGYSVETLCDAVRGVWLVPFNVEGGYTDVTVALRDSANVDRYAGYARNGAPVERRAGSGGAADELAGRLARQAAGGFSGLFDVPALPAGAVAVIEGEVIDG